MRGQAGIFAWKNAALVSNKLLEQVGILEIESVDGEINLRLGARGAHFGERAPATRAAFVGLLWSGFTRHRRWGLLDFAMHRVAAQSGVVLFQLELFGFQLFVASGRITRR